MKQILAVVGLGLLIAVVAGCSDASAKTRDEYRGGKPPAASDEPLAPIPKTPAERLKVDTQKIRDALDKKPVSVPPRTSEAIPVVRESPEKAQRRAIANLVYETTEEDIRTQLKREVRNLEKRFFILVPKTREGVVDYVDRREDIKDQMAGVDQDLARPGLSPVEVKHLNEKKQSLRESLNRLQRKWEDEVEPLVKKQEKLNAVRLMVFKMQLDDWVENGGNQPGGYSQNSWFTSAPGLR